MASRSPLAGSGAAPMLQRQQRAERVGLERFVVRASQYASVEAAEKAAILGLWRTARQHPANSVIVDDGIRLITHGWAGWLRHDDKGQRQIFLFLMPGDFVIPGLLDLDGCDLICLSALCTVDARHLVADGPAPTPASATLVARSGRYYRLLLLDHLTRLTIGSTTRSVAHLISELHARAVLAGACVAGRFTIPIGQRVLARALGRSYVQINNVIGKLQAADLLRVGHGWIDVLQPDALRVLAGMPHSFPDPAHLPAATDTLSDA